MPKSYSVLVPINHNNQDYLPPETIELDDEHAEALLKVNAIGEIVDTEATAAEEAAKVAAEEAVKVAAEEAAKAAAPAEPAKVAAKAKK